MPFKIRFCTTWLSWLLHCIIFQIRKGNELTDKKLMLSFVWIFSALTNQKIMLFSNRGKNVFEYLQTSRLRSRRDILEAKDFLEDSIWQPFYMRFCNSVDENFQHHFAGVEINFFNNLPVGQVISYVCLPEEISTYRKKKMRNKSFKAVYLWKKYVKCTSCKKH